MKKCIKIISIILLVISLSACTSNTVIYGIHNGDWSYKLPNNYEIWRINSREIVCGKKDGENSLSNVINENYVLEFKYNERYVCLKCVETTQNLYAEIDKSNPNFYIIDTMKTPYTERTPILILKIKLKIWVLYSIQIGLKQHQFLKVQNLNK